MCRCTRGVVLVPRQLLNRPQDHDEGDEGRNDQPFEPGVRSVTTFTAHLVYPFAVIGLCWHVHVWGYSQ